MAPFRYSRHGLSPHDRRLDRIFEILPGATSWSLLISMVTLAFWKPRLAAVLIIAFDLYWLVRLVYMTLFLVLSYLKLARERRTDWLALARQAEQRDPYAPRRDQLVHVVILPIIKEGRSIYEPGIRSLLSQQWPARQILMVLAVEGRADASIRKDAQAVQERYRGQFLDFLVAVHPDGLPGEARVKGANATFAAKEAARWLDERGIPFERAVVSCLDADTVVSPAYFACLSYHFMISPERLRASFQPIPVYHNNIWEVPGFARVLDVGSSFFQLVEATNPDKLVTFSSHSMSFKALHEMGYWPVDLISDDSAIFWKAYLFYEGEYQVVPIYVTVSMDVAASTGWRRTVANVYKQKRRWAWGVENFPIVMRGFLQSRRIPLFRRVGHAFKMFEGHVAWATWPFLLGIVGWIPALVAGREFADSVVYYTAPRIAVTIFQLSTLGLITTIILSWMLLPTPPAKRPWVRRLGHLVEWCLVPVTAIGLSAIPALDAQTRLMWGRYMEFWVTDKHR